MSKPPLPIACWSFAAGHDLVRNAEQVFTGIQRAAASGARLLLTPETCLTGYPGAAREDLGDVDLAVLKQCENAVLEQAREHGLVVVLGTASQVDEGWTNDAVVGGLHMAKRRYRKRCLTPLDKQHFVAGGNEGVPIIPLDGWQLGLSICYEVRFPAIWGELATAGADAFITIAHMAGPDPDPGCKAQVVPAHYSSRAAEWATPLVACNTAAADRWFDTGVWDARGLRIATLGEGLLRCELPPRESHHRWYTTIHEDALQHWRR